MFKENVKTTEKFLEAYNKFIPIDIDKSYKIIENTFNFYEKDLNYNPNNPYPECLREAWYKALEEGKIDYSIYNDEYYFTDLWVCWSLFSKNYILSLTKPDAFAQNMSIYDYLSNINSILDLGCGIAYTTGALSQIFIDATIYGTNIINTKQYQFCEEMSKRYNFKLINDILHINHTIDFVFASEYFEHIESPIDHLKDIITRLQPRYFYIANSFNVTSIGHFRYYRYNYDKISCYDISNKFNSILGSYRYKKIRTNLHFDRPTLWEKQYK